MNLKIWVEIDALKLKEFIRATLKSRGTSTNKMKRNREPYAFVLHHLVYAPKSPVQYSSLVKLSTILACDIQAIIDVACGGEIKRRCSKCRERMPLSAFRSEIKEGISRIDSICLACHRIQQKAKRAADPTAHREGSKRYAAANKEKVAAYNKRYQQKNRERLKARFQEWRVKNRSQEMMKQSARRGAYAELVDLDAIASLDNSSCYLCDQSLEPHRITFDHVVPLAKGGSHIFKNLRIACLECNFRKGQNLIESLVWLSDERKASILALIE